MKKITIITDKITLTAELNNSPTADAIWETLPIEGTVNRWGEEIYFDIPVSMDSEPNARADMEVGELGYWPVGSAFCIFFGPTPVSHGDKPRAASRVNVIGMVEGDATRFGEVEDGAMIRLERIEP